MGGGGEGVEGVERVERDDRLEIRNYLPPPQDLEQADIGSKFQEYFD